MRTLAPSPDSGSPWTSQVRGSESAQTASQSSLERWYLRAPTCLTRPGKWGGVSSETPCADRMLGLTPAGPLPQEARLAPADLGLAPLQQRREWSQAVPLHP